MDLLEGCWFFENLLNTKARMPRCHSDPCPSTGLVSQDLLVKDSKGANHSSSISKPPNNSVSVRPDMIQRGDEDDQKGSKLVRQTSDPTVLQAAYKSHCTGIKEVKKSECNSRRSKLLRTPSLPPCIGREERFQVSDPRTGRSPRKPSTPTNIDILPPKQTSKSHSIPICRPARNTGRRKHQ